MIKAGAGAGNNNGNGKSQSTDENENERHSPKTVESVVSIFSQIDTDLNDITNKLLLNGTDKEDYPAKFSPLFPKRVWVNRTVDFSAVVEDLGRALTSEELRTIGRINTNIDNENNGNHENNEKNMIADRLRKSLQLSLGSEAFFEAMMFLRSVAGVEVESSDDDDYLLLELEEIVGADGLKYLDDLFSLITLEEEIENDEDIEFEKFRLQHDNLAKNSEGESEQKLDQIISCS